MTVLEIRPSAPVFRPLLTCFSTITAWSAAAMSALPVAKLTGVTQSPNMAGIRYPDRIGHLRRLAVRSDGASDEGPPAEDPLLAGPRYAQLLVRDESRRRPRQRLLAEERRCRDAVVDEEHQAHEGCSSRDNERATDLPVNAWHGPVGVVVLGGDVVVQPDTPAAEEPQHQCASYRQNAAQPHIARTARQG